MKELNYQSSAKLLQRCNYLVYNLKLPNSAVQESQSSKQSAAPYVFKFLVSTFHKPATIWVSRSPTPLPNYKIPVSTGQIIKAPPAHPVLNMTTWQERRNYKNPSALLNDLSQPHSIFKK